MRACYGEAQKLAARRAMPAFYSQLMVRTAEILEQHADGAPPTRRAVSACGGSRTSQRKGPESDDFWAGVAVGDALLLAAIGDGEISAKEEDESSRPISSPGAAAARG